VPEAERFAVSRRQQRVVDLIGERHPPPTVLVMHRCTEYAEARRMRGVSDLGDLLDLGDWTP